jgi:cytochrome c oxidase assembly protein subunit 15
MMTITNEWTYNDNLFTSEQTEGFYGFVYLITNTDNNRKYIGRKYFTKAKTTQLKGKKKRSRVGSGWEDYWGSNKVLVEEIAVQGKEIADFDPIKTWIEYVNRLIGVVIGFLILLTVVFAFPYLKSNAKIFWLSFLAFILVGFQGWIGSKVVASDLATWMITIHMLIALLIVALLIFTVTNSQEFSIIQFKSDSSLKLFIIIALIISLIQIVSGTQVREKVDHVANLLGEQYRTQWPKFFMEELIFKLHRSWSILSLLISTFLLFKYRSLFERI